MALKLNLPIEAPPFNRWNGEPTGLNNPSALPQGKARGSPFLLLMIFSTRLCNGLVVADFCHSGLVKGVCFNLFAPSDLRPILDKAEEIYWQRSPKLFAGGVLSPLASTTRPTLPPVVCARFNIPATRHRVSTIHNL